MANTPSAAPPSALAAAVAAAIVSGLAGYYIGQAKSIGIFGTPGRKSEAGREYKHADTISSDETEESEEEDAHDSADAAADLSSFSDSREECKLVLVVRTDLGMSKGKIAAQCSHATLACYKTLHAADPAHPILRRWERLGQAKVALKTDGGEEDLLLLQAQAQSLGICAQVIHDAGRTQIAAGSATVLGVGPAPKSKVDEVTGHLKLL